MKYKLYAAMTVLTVLVIPLGSNGLSMLAQKAYATDYVLRDGPSCTSLPISGGSATWDEINQFCRITGTLTLSSSDSLTIDNVHLVLDSGGGIDNSGTITLIRFFASIDNISGGTITNSGTMTIDTEDGASGYIRLVGGTFENSGILNINQGGQFLIGNHESDTTFENTGTVNNYGYLEADIATIMNDGRIINEEGGTISIRFSTVNNNDGGSIGINGGTLHVSPDSTINNYGTLTTSNSGTISIDGCCGEVGPGTIENYGAINNEGTIDNSGIINNYCESSFTGSGAVNGNQPEDNCNVDTQAPQVTFKVEDGKGKELSNGGSTNSKSIEIKFTVTDNVGVESVECSLEGPGTRFDMALSPCTSPIELSKLVKGTYTFTVIATDEAENQEPQTFTWTVKSP